MCLNTAHAHHYQHIISKLKWDSDREPEIGIEDCCVHDLFRIVSIEDTHTCLCLTTNRHHEGDLESNAYIEKHANSSWILTYKGIIN